MSNLFHTPGKLVTPLAAASLLAACSVLNSPMSTPTHTPSSPPSPSAPSAAPPSAAATRPAAAPTTTTAPRATPPAAVAAVPKPSGATSPLAYRRDAAAHLYALNADRIYQGMLQPNLHAVGVLDIDLDRQGQITTISWRRAPSHVPEVMAEIVRTVRAAAPFPVPARMGRVTYTDIWLWDKSGKFQLDTLTEGQL